MGGGNERHLSYIHAMSFITLPPLGPTQNPGIKTGELNAHAPSMYMT